MGLLQQVRKLSQKTTEDIVNSKCYVYNKSRHRINVPGQTRAVRKFHPLLSVETSICH